MENNKTCGETMLTDEEERLQWFRNEVLPLEPLLRRRAFSFCRDGSVEILDLVHDTFAILLSHEAWRDVIDVRAFAVVTLKNAARRLVTRRAVIAIDCLANLDEIEFDEPGAERQIEGRDELRFLSRVISELPPKCRRVFTLCKVFGLTHRAIAEQLGLSAFTVEKHVSKGLRICTERLASQYAPMLNTSRILDKARECGVNE